MCFLLEFGTEKDIQLRSGAGDGCTQVGATESNTGVLEADGLSQ